MWWSTVMSFVYIPNASLWLALLLLDLGVYFFIFSQFGGAYIAEDGTTNYGGAPLDPFGKNIIKQHLEEIIEKRLSKKRDDDLYKQVKNREKLKKEARKKKRDAANMRRKNQFDEFKQRVHDKWSNLKDAFNGLSIFATSTKLTKDTKQNNAENANDSDDSADSNNKITFQ